MVIFRDKNKTEGKKPSTFKRLYAYFAILTAIFLVCAVIFTVIIATQWNAMLSDLPARYVEVGVLLILDAVRLFRELFGGLCGCLRIAAD